MKIAKIAEIQTPALYAITPEFESDSELYAWAESLLKTGSCPILQYRDKTHNAPQKLARAHVLRTITESTNTLFIINDSVLLCLKANADGVHLGETDGSIFLARQLLGRKIIGVSSYASLKTAERAQKMGADYVAFGAVFPSTTKPQAQSVNLERIALAKMALTIPVVAIGGITPQNAAQVLKTGVDFIAVSHALFTNPKKAVQDLQPLFSQQRR